MRKVVKVRLLAKPGTPVVFDQPTLPRHRTLRGVKHDDLGNLIMLYELRPDDRDVELAHYRLVEVDEIYDAARYSAVYAFNEEELSYVRQGKPKRTWVLLENNHPNLGP